MDPNAPPTQDLVLGIDGGGTKTMVWLAAADRAGPPQPAGQGSSGPSNPRAVGLDRACAHLDEAIEQAFRAAGQPRAPVAAACLALAGTGTPEMRTAVRAWCDTRHLAGRVAIVHDALAVLRAATATGSGIALIAGTGSLAYGWAGPGREARAGGWGYVFGDEGSSYALGVAALRAVTQAADGRHPATRLTSAVLGALKLTAVPELVAELCSATPPRERVAALAPIVTRAADDGDPAAQRILDQAAGDLAELVGAVARQLDLPSGTCQLALAGGLLIHCDRLRRALIDRLGNTTWTPAEVHVVAHPVLGAVRLAQALV